MGQTVQQMIVSTAIANGVDPNLALAVAQRESNFTQSAIGADGEIGVFQLMPTTAQGLGVNPNDLQQNINGGIQYLKQQLNTFGDPATAVAAYNGGPGNPYNSQSQAYSNSVMNIYSQYANQDTASQLISSDSISIDSTGVNWGLLAVIAAVGLVAFSGGNR